MQSPDLATLLVQTDALARRAADLLVAMQQTRPQASRKERRDIVTAADLASERLLIDGLRAITPGAAVLSEEAGMDGSADAPRWIVDPLDGTVNYASGLSWFSATMAYQERGRTLLGIVHAPLANLVAHYTADGVATISGAKAAVSRTGTLADAVVSVMLTSSFSPADVRRTSGIVRRLADRTRGVRIIVSGALELCLVAAGQLDAFVSIKADIVSHAAGMPLVRAAGGRVTTMLGRAAGDGDREKIASNGIIHDELLRVLLDG